MLRLQDDIYSLFNLELTGNEGLLTSPSITASLLSERERALSFLNLQIALSSSKPEKLLAKIKNVQCLELPKRPGNVPA